MFNNEIYEANSYDEVLADYEKAALKTTTSLSTLSFGQSAIFGTAVTAVMFMAVQGIQSGDFYIVMLLCQPSWRNGLAHWTSNSKVVGSSPTEGVPFFLLSLFFVCFRCINSWRFGYGERTGISIINSFIFPWLCVQRCSTVIN